MQRFGKNIVTTARYLEKKIKHKQTRVCLIDIMYK